MAASITATEERVPQVSLRILVDREKNRVLFAESEKDFADVLLSFLTLPLGTIARLVGKESNMQSVRVGCLSSLYESVANLEEKHLSTETCKSMLLQPRNSMDAYCRNLKLNIDDTEPSKFFICEDWNCSRREGALLSTFRNLKCSCGKLMNREIFEKSQNLSNSNGFVQGTATFIVCEDLNVIPNVLGTSVVLLQNLGTEDMDAIEEMTVNVTKKEVVDLLKCSLLSKTPLTDLFLKKKIFIENFSPKIQSQIELEDMPIEEGRKMVVKLLLRKSNSSVLFAQAEEDFADFLFSFLTFPLGGVLHMLNGSSSLSCIDKLYKSVAELNADRYLKSQALKDNLANPRCAPQFNLSNQILPIGAASFPQYYCYPYPVEGASCGYLSTWLLDGGQVRTNFIDPKSSTRESKTCLPKKKKKKRNKTSSPGGFAKGPSMYMVTDDLVVTPMSTISGVSFLNRSKVPFSDIEERVISIGVKEGLSILRASLISTSALTNGLSQIIKNVKEEN